MIRPGARRTWIAKALLHAALVIGAVIALFPLAWMVLASLMPSGQANSYPPRLLPHPLTLAHYHRIFVQLRIGRYLLNSAIVTVAITAISLLVNALAGYAFAKLRFRGRDRTFRVLTLGLVVPVQISMLPLFLMFKELGLINSYWGVIIPSLASIFGIFLVRQYTAAIPDDLLDAARIDGAGEFRVFWSVVLPVITPILATLAIWTFLTAWNDFMWPLIVLTDDAKYTLPVALANLSGEHVQDTELMMAASVITVVPVLAAFLLLQRYYVRGILTGSVKG